MSNTPDPNDRETLLRELQALRAENAALRQSAARVRSPVNGGGGGAKAPLSEEAFRLLVEGVKDYAIFMLDPQGHVSTWNAGAERIKGYSAPEIIGQHFSRFYPPEEVAAGKPARELEIARETGKYEEEGIRLRKDGSEFWANVLITALYDETGRLRGFSKVTKDVTERRRADEALRAAKEQAEQASRAKDQFMAVLSHELRTPLTPILATVSFVEKRSDVPEDVRVEIGALRRNVELETRLVNDLLDMTRLGRGKVVLHPEVVDALGAIHHAVQNVQKEIEQKELDLTLSLRARNPYIWGDPDRIQQVLVNLLQNAVKFTPREGSVTVRCTNDGLSVRIEVKDTGVGIDPEVLPRLFSPFEQGERTVTRKFGGLGLGLSIAKSLVDMHKGTLTAASDGSGKGASFVLTLGAVSGIAEDGPAPGLVLDAPAAGARPATRPAPGGGDAGVKPGETPKGGQILLVEDHEDTRRIVAKILGSFGYSVKTAGSVAEAMELADREHIDLLVSDIGLPDGSGHDVMRHVGKHGVKGIALSGFGQDEDIRRSAEAGFETHLVKPVNFQALESVVRRAVSSQGGDGRATRR